MLEPISTSPREARPISTSGLESCWATSYWLSTSSWTYSCSRDARDFTDFTCACTRGANALPRGRTRAVLSQTVYDARGGRRRATEHGNFRAMPIARPIRELLRCAFDFRQPPKGDVLSRTHGKEAAHVLRLLGHLVATQHELVERCVFLKRGRQGVCRIVAELIGAQIETDEGRVVRQVRGERLAGRVAQEVEFQVQVGERVVESEGAGEAGGVANLVVAHVEGRERVVALKCCLPRVPHPPVKLELVGGQRQSLEAMVLPLFALSARAQGGVCSWLRCHRSGRTVDLL
eukprot:5730516-Prymnesium_polylepis.2